MNVKNRQSKYEKGVSSVVDFHIKEEAVAAPIDPFDEKRLKDEIDDSFSRRIDEIREIDPVLLDVYGFMDPILRRRKEAIKGMAISVALEGKDIRGLQDPLKNFAYFETQTHTTYDMMENENYLSIAAAIWILDDLRRTGKLSEAYAILPTDYLELPELPLDFYSPCYEPELIQSVMAVLRCRVPENGWLSELEAMRHPFNPYDDDPENEELNALERKRLIDLHPRRERFEKLMDLLDPKSVQDACVSFRILHRDIIGARLKCDAVLERELKKAEDRYQIATKGLSVLERKADPEEEHQKMLDALEMFDRKRSLLNENFFDFLVFHRSYIIRTMETGGRDIADAIGNIMIQDPYEMCFAALYLLSKGDDRAWCFNTTQAILHCTVHRLPWFTENEDIRIKHEQSMEFDRNNWLNQVQIEPMDWYNTWYGNQNLAQIVYDLTRGVIPRYLHPLEKERNTLIDEKKLDYHEADVITRYAEMMFHGKFRARAANIDAMTALWADTEQSGEDRKAEENQNDDSPGTQISSLNQWMPGGGYWGSIARAQGRTDLPEGSQKEEESSRIDHQSRQAESKKPDDTGPGHQPKEQVKMLQRMLTEMNRAFKQEKGKYEREMMSLRQEHQELVDLRELVFSLQQKEDTDQKDEERKITFPYECKKKNVAFGGHDSFLKQIRPLLPNVRFIGPDSMTLNPEVIRNADTIWIQTNCISHAQYNIIMAVSRQYHVQVRYFTASSASRCAAQLAAVDKL